MHPVLAVVITSAESYAICGYVPEICRLLFEPEQATNGTSLSGSFVCELRVGPVTYSLCE
jgi:hypothetical protein